MKNTKRILVLFLAAALMLALAGCSSSDYKAAAALYENGDFKAASEKFAALGDYKDSADLAVKSDYMYARELYYAGAYEAAAMAFNALGDYEDSGDMATECVYKLGVETFNAGKYADAIEIFLEVEDYEDSEDFISRARDAIIRESVLGEWKCVYNMENDIAEVFGAGDFFDSDMDPMDYFDFSGLEAVYSLILNEDDTFTLDVDKASYDKGLDGLVENMKAGMRAMIEALLTKELAAEGFTLTEFMSEYGITDIDQLIAMSLGMDLDEFVEATMSVARADVAFAQFPLTGTFTISDTTVSFDDGSKAEYNAVLEQLEASLKAYGNVFQELTFTR